MTIQSEQIAHKDLVSGSQTTLHSHAGGGSQEIQTGQSIAPKATVVQVDFSPDFSGIPRISISPWSDHLVLITEVTTTYFKWDNDSKNVDVTVDWIAIYA
jgi:hypothetical protein